jgi:hypothetical protein
MKNPSLMQKSAINRHIWGKKNPEIDTKPCGSGLVWRGGLSERRIAPFDCEAVVKPVTAF